MDILHCGFCGKVVENPRQRTQRYCSRTCKYLQKANLEKLRKAGLAPLSTPQSARKACGSVYKVKQSGAWMAENIGATPIKGVKTKRTRKTFHTEEEARNYLDFITDPNKVIPILKASAAICAEYEISKEYLIWALQTHSIAKEE